VPGVEPYKTPKKEGPVSYVLARGAGSLRPTQWVITIGKKAPNLLTIEAFTRRAQITTMKSPNRVPLQLGLSQACEVLQCAAIQQPRLVCEPAEAKLAKTNITERRFATIAPNATNERQRSDQT
jgi:hypothetical protein